MIELQLHIPSLLIGCVIGMIVGIALSVSIFFLATDSIDPQDSPMPKKEGAEQE